jgi:hypothetical protein
LGQHPAVRAHRAALSLTFAVFFAAVIAPAAWAAAPSPKVYQNLPEAERSSAIKAYVSARLNLRAMGVDRIYPQFAPTWPVSAAGSPPNVLAARKFPSEGLPRRDRLA